MSIRMIVADDSDVLRRGIRQLLGAQKGFEIVGEAANFAQADQLIKDLKPDLVILDIHMPGEITFLSKEFKSRLRGSRLLAISIWADEQTQELAESLGAAILLDKANLGQTLIPTVVDLCRRPN